MMDLITRFVVAVEQIAAALCNPVVVAGSPGPAVVTQTTPVAQTQAAGAGTTAQTQAAGAGTIDYDAIAAREDGHAVLKGICEQRGIEVKTGQKKTTLVKALKSWDVVHGASATQGATTQSPPPETCNTQQAQGGAPDPFGTGATDPLATQAPPVQITRELCLEVLKPIATSHGAGVVSDMLITHGGTAMLKDVPEENLVAVYNAAANFKG